MFLLGRQRWREKKTDSRVSGHMYSFPSTLRILDFKPFVILIYNPVDPVFNSNLRLDSPTTTMILEFLTID